MIRTAIICSMILLTVPGKLAAMDNVDFATQIAPLFEEHCYKCHGEKKGLGKLRLHTVEVIKKRAGEDAELLVGGSPTESELYQRLVLPKDHKKRMPKGGEPLSQDKIDLISQWITQGAIFAAVASSDTSVPEASTNRQPTESLPLPEVPPASEVAIERLTAAGAQVSALFSDSNLLTVSFGMGGSPAADEQIASLPTVSEQVYSLNLAAAEVSENAWSPLARLSNLTRIHLENSSVTDKSLPALSGLERLEYLNLYGTNITDAGLKHLENLTQLRSLYLWQTKVSFEAARSLEEKIPGLEVNLGFDHPEVARRRLAKEIETTKLQLETSKSEFSQAESQLKSATAAKETAEKRLVELDKQLKSLLGEPAAESALEAEKAPEN